MAGNILEQLPISLMDEDSGHRYRYESFLPSDEKGKTRVEPELLLANSALEGRRHPQDAAQSADASDLTDGVLPTLQSIARTSRSLTVEHASPLAPLRARDTQALDEMFGQDDRQEITLDILHYLARIYPEPCWEDEPYEFLNGYV